MAKMNENSIMLLDFLKANADKKLTVDQIAEATGLSKPTITGVFNSFVKKGLGYRYEETVMGDIDVTLLTLTDAGKDFNTANSTDTTKVIVARMSDASYSPETLDDMAAATGIDKKVINGSFNALARKGIAARVPATTQGPVVVKYLALTDDGMVYIPEVEDAAE